jgi:thiol-disulfide isomerase/thioredoxin
MRPNPRRNRLFVSAALAVLVALASAGSAVADVNVGDRAPELVQAKDGRGKRVKLKAYRGKLVVLTFGASWCKPCKKELPAWDKLARKYKGQNVTFLAVNIDKELAKGRAFMKEARLGAMQAAYEPDSATVESYEPPTMPTTYVIDGRGIVRFRHAGYRAGDEKALAAKLDALLAK